MKSSTRKYLGIAVAVVVVFVLLGAALVEWKWPWREAIVRQALEKATGSQIVIGNFRPTYFPPGCVMGSIRVTNPEAKGYPPVFTATGVTVSTRYGVMLSLAKRIVTLDIASVQINIPPKGVPRALHPWSSNSTSDFSIDHVMVKHGVLEFLSDAPEKAPTVLEIHHLGLENATKDQPMNFDAALHVPSPPGEIRSQGSIGPWKNGKLEATPVSGTYELEQMDLAALKGVSGLLKAQGKFSGVLDAMTVQGTAGVPDFHVIHSGRAVGHPVSVSSNYHALASVLTANTSIESLQAKWNDSTLNASGKLIDVPGTTGKTLFLNTAISRGRVEDLLILFTRQPEPSMRGALRFKAQIVVPPKPPKFLQRIRATGDFEIQGARFTNRRLQNLMDKLDRSASGVKNAKANKGDAPLVLSDFSGHANARAGTAVLSKVLVTSPGSRVLAEGTFDLVDKTVNLNGLLQTQGKLSATTSGFKSLILKAMTPLWLHKNSISDVPFRVTGKPGHLHFALKFKRTNHL